MAKPGPKPVALNYALSLGLTKRQMRRLGGMERLQAMPQDARDVIVSQSRIYAAKVRASRLIEVKR